MKIRSSPAPTTQHSDLYLDYLSSPAWQLVRAAALQRAGNRCERGRGTPHRCPVTTGLEVHHTTYTGLGSEAWGDLRVLCGAHHREEDARRRGLGRLR